MKLVRRPSANHSMTLFDFASRHLPRSLKTFTRGAGSYGVEYMIGAPSFLHAEKDVAKITDCMDGSATLELYSPEYFADMEDLIKKFEKSTGREVTFEYWQ